MRPLLIACLLLLPACSPVRPPERVQRQAPTAEGDELAQLVDLAQLVAVGQVEVRKEEPSGVHYQVLLQEVLVGDRLAPDQAATHPTRPGGELRVSSFLYRPGQPASEVPKLQELSRFIFFLAPTETPGEWLNLADPNGYSLPAARETLEKLRAKRPQ